MRRLGGTLAVLAAVVTALALGAAPAVAADATTIEFVTKSPVQTAFGGNWNVQLVTRWAQFDDTPVPSDQATVTVHISGSDEPLAERLPIQPDGSVYVSIPSSRTLPPGEYQLSADIVPVANSYLAGSSTTAPLILEVTAYAIVAGLQMDEASVAAETPVAELSLSGQFVESTGSVPAGTWAITVRGDGKDVLQTEVAQAAGVDGPLRYEITEKLDRGADYTVSAAFTPIESLAAGLEVTQPQDLTFHTPGGNLGDPIPYPLWLLIVTCLVPLALLAAVIVLTVRLSRRPVPVAEAPRRDPVQPAQDEPGWDPFASAHAEPEPPTQVLPPSPVAQPPLTTPPAAERSPAHTEVVPPAQGSEPTFTELLQGVPPQHEPAAQPDTRATESWSLSDDDEDSAPDPR